MRYELFYLVGASREAELETIRKDVTDIVTGNGGVFSEKETQEKRKLAYKIKHETHGIYVAQRFETDPEKLPEISNKINLYPAVLRFIISKATELPELKSKEERIQEASLKSDRKTTIVEETKPKEEKKEIKKSEIKEEQPVTETPKEPEKTEEKKKEEPKDDDIDKKLEEILNI